MSGRSKEELEALVKEQGDKVRKLKEDKVGRAHARHPARALLLGMHPAAHCLCAWRLRRVPHAPRGKGGPQKKHRPFRPAALPVRAHFPPLGR